MACLYEARRHPLFSGNWNGDDYCTSKSRSKLVSVRHNGLQRNEGRIQSQFLRNDQTWFFCTTCHNNPQQTYVEVEAEVKLGTHVLASSHVRFQRLQIRHTGKKQVDLGLPFFPQSRTAGF